MSSDESKPLRKLSRHPSPNPLLVSPLETAYEGAKDARDIILDQRRREARQARELPDYSDEGESTARHEAIVVNNHFHQPQPSQPDIEPEASVEVGPVKVRGLPKWAIAATGIAVAAIVAIVSKLLAR